MTDIHSFENFVPLPIVQAARETAEAFARKQLTPEKALQVRLNTLAVWVMNDYLQMMGVATNLTGSDSWNPVMRLWADVADLALPDLGRLECRGMIAPTLACAVPPEVWEDRIGYVVLQFDRDLQTAYLAGFTTTVATESLSLSQLQPPENLFDHLYDLRTAAAPAAGSRTRVSLSQWLDGMIDTGWQTLDALLGPQLSPAFAFRGEPDAEAGAPALLRAKRIDLGLQVATQPVVLLVEVQPAAEVNSELDPELQIRLQLHPMGDRAFLPPTLRLTVLDASGATFLSAQAREADNYIQLQLNGQPGEQFSARIDLADASVTESFTI